MKQEQNQKISQKRRKLLKSAAAGAPVIATLQSGAAFANTSAFQCINDASSSPPTKAVAVPPPDQWVRVTVSRYQFTDNTNPANVTDWLYDIDGVYASGSSTGVVGPFYDASGNTVSVDLANWTETASEQVAVIQYYEVNPAHTAVVGTLNPYPKQVVTDSNTQVPLNASCLASMQ